MIADSGVLASSPWYTDSLMKEAGDYFRNVSQDSSLQGMDLDLATLESEIERVRQQHNSLNDLSPMSLEVDSRGASVASSECSDEPYLDIESNLEELLFSCNTSDQEYLTTSLHSLLELGDVPSGLEWPDSGWSHLGNTEEVHDAEESSSSTSSSSEDRFLPSHKSYAQQHRVSKQWSKMSCEEQVEVVEELSRVISNELGLREQLEVIKMISPSADVSPTDKEFVIDLESITEEKLKQIQEFIKEHIEPSNSVDVCPDNSHSPQRKYPKKQAKDRKSQHKAVRQRQRKEYRQMMKEKRSGLFIKEEVLALSVCEPIEEAEVDILA
ncbi:protein FAM199X-like [Liolophura sinensis]|uniref:protein FAM199X-like n=1 Tax=Liolophura sinensis TaxID=3198878 RepID=UPI0031582064